MIFWDQGFENRPQTFQPDRSESPQRQKRNVWRFGGAVAREEVYAVSRRAKEGNCHPKDQRFSRVSGVFYHFWCSFLYGVLYFFLRYAEVFENFF